MVVLLDGSQPRALSIFCLQVAIITCPSPSLPSFSLLLKYRLAKNIWRRKRTFWGRVRGQWKLTNKLIMPGKSKTAMFFMLKVRLNIRSPLATVITHSFTVHVTLEATITRITSGIKIYCLEIIVIFGPFYQPTHSLLVICSHTSITREIFIFSTLPHSEQ